MKPTIVFLATLFAFAAIAADSPPPKTAEKPQSVRQRFTGEVSKDGNGATIMELSPRGDTPGLCFAMIHAMVRDKFPLIEKTKTLFNVYVTEGDDDHLVLEVTSKDVTEKVELQRDVSASATIDGTKYDFSYPSTYVAPGGKPMTNKALIIIERKKEK